MITVNATIFYAFHICPREAWYYARRLDPPKEHPLLDLGRLVHQYSYQRHRKEIFVDQLLKIDLFRGELVAEVKKSSRHKEAAKLQLAYYLYYLKHEKGLEMQGILLFPKERKTEKLELTPELERRVKDTLHYIQKLLSQDQPPPPKRIRYCKTCSFLEMCWG